MMWSVKIVRGVIPGGAGGGGCGPPNFFFSGFSHTSDKKVPSEVVKLLFFS